MKRRLTMLLACLSLAVGGVMAQTNVKGIVVSEEDGSPVTGATIQVIGTNTGTVSDVEGRFSLTLPAGKNRLRVSFIGMETRDVTANRDMRIELRSNAALDEVLVVAYGKTTKEKFTGAASMVNSEKLDARQISDVSNALAGNVAGLTAFKSNGQPGTSSTIRIRGFGSLNAGMSPLYVVDGMTYDGDIANIDPNDIESISVLKDAAAASLYGSRAANGVILITTKSGQRNTAAKVTFDASWGANSREIKGYDVIKSTDTYYETMYGSYYNNAIYNLGYGAADAYAYANTQATNATGYKIYTLPTGENLFTTAGKINPNATLGYGNGTYYYLPDDWEKESFHNGMRQEYKASVSGGTDRISYYFGASYLDDEGVIEHSAFDRISTRANVDYQAKDWLKLSANLSYTNTTSKYPDNQTSSGSSGNAFYMAYYLAPVYPFYVRNADGSLAKNGNNYVYDYGNGEAGATRNYMSIANPIGDLVYQTEDYLMDIFSGRWGVEITPVKGLTVTGRIGMDLDNTRFHYASSSLYGQAAAYGGEAEQEHMRTLSVTQQYMATYDTKFAREHSLDVLLGYESYDYTYEYSYGYGQNLYREGSWALGNVIDQYSVGGAQSKESLRSVIGRVNYDYAERYFVSGSVRTDGSSRFAPGHRWGTFWSASAAWNIGKEKFLESQSWIDLLKLRLSFGQQGNKEIGNYYAYMDQYYVTGSNGVFADGTLAYKGNEDLTWETTNAFDVAVDFNFWTGRLSGSIDYYNRTTHDMLYYKPVAGSNGYTSIPMNIGSLRNQGFEIDLHSLLINRKNLKWNIDFNIAHNSNTILKLAPELEGELIDGSSIYQEGESMYQYYLVKYAGVEKTTGLALYWARDDNDNEYVTTDRSVAYNTNRQPTGSLEPDFFGGFGTSLEFYGFDLSVQFSYQFGGRVYDNTYASLMHTGGSSSDGMAWHKDILKAWTPENTNTSVPRLSTGASDDQYAVTTCDRFLISSNYLSLNNITAGYTLPKSWTRKLYIEGLRLYFSADNVAMLSARKGLDPRVGISSVANYTYSALRTITGGIKITF